MRDLAAERRSAPIQSQQGLPDPQQILMGYAPGPLQSLQGGFEELGRLVQPFVQPFAQGASQGVVKGVGDMAGQFFRWSLTPGGQLDLSKVTGGAASAASSVVQTALPLLGEAFQGAAGIVVPVASAAVGAVASAVATAAVPTIVTAVGTVGSAVAALVI